MLYKTTYTASSRDFSPIIPAPTRIEYTISDEKENNLFAAYK